MAKRRILVVEDDRAIRRGILDAKDGKEGTRMALRFDYDLLLLDLILPKGDGLQILEAASSRLRQDAPRLAAGRNGEATRRSLGEVGLLATASFACSPKDAPWLATGSFT